jgi:hypothetical protein
MVVGTSLPLIYKFSVSPFLFMSSGSPYNITTGQDLFDTGFTTARPALMSGLSQGACQDSGYTYSAGFGCFNLNPAPGVATIERNSGRGPAIVNLNLRLSRTWSFGSKGESSGPGDRMGGPMRMGGPRGGGGGGPRGGGMRGGGGPPPGMFGGSSGKKYSLTLSISARNVLNHPNYAAPSGDLSSPYFGEYRALTGGFGPMSSASTYNRRIDVMLRFTF